MRIVEACDAAFWKSAAWRKARGRISLADCFALALAERLDAKLHTTDHRDFDLLVAAGETRIVFIR